MKFNVTNHASWQYSKRVGNDDMLNALRRSKRATKEDMYEIQIEFLKSKGEMRPSKEGDIVFRDGNTIFFCAPTEEHDVVLVKTVWQIKE